jgi:hypothetical protein
MAVDKQIVLDQLNNLGPSSKFGVGKELKYLHEVINEGENILGTTRGFYEKNTWLICVTDRRLLFLDKGMVMGLNSTEIPLDSVGSVNHKTGMLLGEITVTAAGVDKHIGKIRKKDTKIIANLISEATAKMKKEMHSGGAAPATGVSKMDEIKKLAELKETGILTEDEFNEEKAKLLN